MYTNIPHSTCPHPLRSKRFFALWSSFFTVVKTVAFRLEFRTFWPMLGKSVTCEMLLYLKYGR